MVDKTGIVIVTLELSPFFKVTGVGDLLHNIVAELVRRQIPVTVICPDFGCDYPNLTFKKSLSFYAAIGGHASPLQFRQATDGRGVTYFFLKDKDLEQYLKNLPGESSSEETAKLCLEFCYAAYLVLEALSKGEFGFEDTERLVVHAFHWQTGPLLALVKQGRWPRPLHTVLTVDILDRQGRFNPEVFEAHEIFHALRIKNDEEINFLRLGIETADILHTVSPNYAREIQQAPYGRGLESILKQRHQEGRLLGILNGLDPMLTDWQCIPVLKDNGLCIVPENDRVLEHKKKAKLLFQKVAGLPVDPGAFLISMGHRFVTQKNFALVAGAMDELMALTPRPQLYLRAWPEPARQDQEQELWWQITRFSKRYRFNLAFLSPYDRDQSLDPGGHLHRPVSLLRRLGSVPHAVLVGALRPLPAGGHALRGHPGGDYGGGTGGHGAARHRGPRGVGLPAGRPFRPPGPGGRGAEGHAAQGGSTRLLAGDGAAGHGLRFQHCPHR